MGAGNPTLPAIDGTEASTKQNTVHSGTGTLYKPWDVDENNIPSHATHITQWEHRVKGLLAGACAGMVVDLGGRDIGAFAVNYKHAAVACSFPGDDGTTLDASDDHYIYLDDDEVLEVNHVAFPADSYHLAYVETNADDITLLEDRRWENADVGGTNAWSAVAATQDVDMDDNSLEDVEGIDFTAPTELTIVAGVITPTQFFHTVDTEGDAAADDLNTITATAGKLQFLLLVTENVAHVVTVKDSTGNISLIDGDFVMDDADSMILLMQVNDTDWIEISRNRNTLLLLTDALDCNGENIADVGMLRFNLATELTIAAGVIAVNQSRHWVDTEADAAEDDLDTINGGSNHDILIISAMSALRTIVVKHGTGNITLANGQDFALEEGGASTLVLMFNAVWFEIARSPLSIEDLVDTARSIPYPLQFSAQNVTIALAAGVLDEWWFYCPYEMVIINATAYVVDAPAVNPCIVDILDDGLSIFGVDANCMVIPAAGHQDTSNPDSNIVVAAGSILKCEIRATDGSPNGADHLTVSINAMIAPKSEP